MTLHDSFVSLANSWRKVVILDLYLRQSIDITTMIKSLWYICLAWIISQNVFFFLFCFVFLDKCNSIQKEKDRFLIILSDFFEKSEKAARWRWAELCYIRWVDIRMGHCSERSLFQKTMFEFSNFRIMTFQNNKCSQKNNRWE